MRTMIFGPIAALAAALFCAPAFAGEDNSGIANDSPFKSDGTVASTAPIPYPHIVGWRNPGGPAGEIVFYQTSSRGYYLSSETGLITADKSWNSPGSGGGGLYPDTQEGDITAELKFASGGTETGGILPDETQLKPGGGTKTAPPS